jgi:hypothetical protein
LVKLRGYAVKRLSILACIKLLRMLKLMKVFAQIYASGTCGNSRVLALQLGRFVEILPAR